MPTVHRERQYSTPPRGYSRPSPRPARGRRDKGEALKREIAEGAGNTAVDVLVADRADQTAIRRLAGEFHGRYAHLHVLVNNAASAPTVSNSISRSTTWRGSC